MALWSIASRDRKTCSNQDGYGKKSKSELLNDK